MKKIQENSHSMNLQFVQNLNKQKELADREIISREQTIILLDRHVKKITEDFNQKISKLQNENNMLISLNNSLNKNKIVQTRTKSCDK
jgi:hypothetical protein